MQRRWLLLLSLNVVLISITLLGLVLTMTVGTMTFAVGLGMGIGIGGYLLSTGLLWRRASPVLSSHLTLLTISVALCVTMVLSERLWLFVPVMTAIIPMIAVQLIGGRAAVGWIAVIVLSVSAMFALEQAELWFMNPALVFGEFEHVFIALSLPAVVVALTWYQEGARARAQAVSSFQSAVLARMSHELRTPLNGVMGMLRVFPTDNLTDQQRTQLDAAGQAGRALLDIVDDALELLPAESGLVSSHREPFDLRASLERLCAHHGASRAKPEVEIQLRYPSEVPSRFCGDGPQVLRVVDKLIDNALKFTDRGHVRISVEHRAARESEPPCLTLHVADTGIGIPEDQRELVFDRFAQVEATWNRTRGGTGLGLAVCHELVTRMGGLIEVTSVEDRGSEFRVMLPLARAPERSPTEDPDSAPALAALAAAGVVTPMPTLEAALDPSGPPPRALVVEDNPINQVVTQRMLERCGCQVDVAQHGRQALECLEQHPYDIVFMDIQMPVMDGLQATAAIRSSPVPRIASLPVVALTAYTMAGDRERCLSAGMDGYVGKPISAEALAAELQRLTPKPEASASASA